MNQVVRFTSIVLVSLRCIVSSLFRRCCIKIEESVLAQWVVEELSGKPGASVLYSDLAIQTMATVKAVYRLAGRQCQGFLKSIFELMGIDLPVPEYSILSRRLGQLSIELSLIMQPSPSHPSTIQQTVNCSTRAEI